MTARPRSGLSVQACAIGMLNLLEMIIADNRLISHYSKDQQCAEQRNYPSQDYLRGLLTTAEE